jgi:hypothetical protein
MMRAGSGARDPLDFDEVASTGGAQRGREGVVVPGVDDQRERQAREKGQQRRRRRRSSRKDVGHEGVERLAMTPALDELRDRPHVRADAPRRRRAGVQRRRDGFRRRRRRRAGKSEKARTEIGDERVGDERAPHALELVGDVAARFGFEQGFHGQSSSPILRALTVIGSCVSMGMSGSISVHPLRNVTEPPHKVSRSVATIGSSRSFFGT